MKVLDSTIRAYRLSGNTISEASMDAVLNAAYAMLAANDEIVPSFDDWEVEEVVAGGDRVLSYFTTTDTGAELRASFSFNEGVARVMLLSGEDECFVGDNLLCTVRSGEKYTVEDWL
jgi:hypothetical protein